MLIHNSGHARYVIAPYAMKTIFCGAAQSFVIDVDDRLHAWGLNNNNFVEWLGPMYSLESNAVRFTGAKQVASGNEHALILDTSGQVWGIGHNIYHETDPRVTTSWPTPFVTPLLSGIQKVACCGNSSYALATNGVLYSWGRNDFLQTDPTVSSTTEVATYTTARLTNIVDICAGWRHVSALDSSGNVRAIGSNSFLQVDATQLTSWYASSWNTIVKTGVKSLGSGSGTGFNTAVIMANDDLVIWGYNAYGGSKPAAGATAPIADISNVVKTGIKKVVATVTTTFALDYNGNLYAWGSDASYIISGTTTTDKFDTATPILTGVKDFSAGGNTNTAVHVMAIMETEKLYTWGSNWSGESDPPTQAAGGHITSKSHRIIIT